MTVKIRSSVPLTPFDLAASGLRRHRVSLENPGERVSDPGGGYIYEWHPCDPPEIYAQIDPASVQRLSEIIAGTLIATATHLVTVPFHPQIGVTTRLTFTTHETHQLYVIHPPINVENRDILLHLVCSEVVGGSVPVLIDQLKAPAPLTPMTVGGL